MDNNENLQLALILFLSQNPQFIEQLRPALEFYKTHEQTLTTLINALTNKEHTTPMPDLQYDNAPTMPENKPQKEPTQNREKRSPLQEIAGNEISQLIDNYLKIDRL